MTRNRDSADLSGALELTASDRRQLEHAYEVLADPFARASLGEWQRDVLRTLRPLLRADMASMLLPVPGAEVVVSEEVPLDDLWKFSCAIAPLDRRWSVWERQVALAVSDRRLLWGPYMAEYLQSTYYNEYIVPGRYFDALVLNVPLSETPGPRSVAGLWFHHADEAAAPFGERGIAVLRLLLPAFRAAAANVRLVGRHRASLARSLDATGAAVEVASLDGTPLHRTPVLESTLAADPQRELLEHALRAVAVDVARCVMRTKGRRVALDPPPAATRELTTALGRYTVTATLGGEDLATAAPNVLTGVVFYLPVPSASDSPGRIAARFHLTPREVAVALLLAEGHSYPTVAARLGMSVHTARRHGERVYAKLRVHSKAAIPSALRR